MQANCSVIGVASLKEKQKEAIPSFVEGRDVFVYLGYGNSLCSALLLLVFDNL